MYCGLIGDGSLSPLDELGAVEVWTHQRAHQMLDKIRGYLRDEQGAEIIEWVIVWLDAAP